MRKKVVAIVLMGVLAFFGSNVSYAAEDVASVDPIVEEYVTESETEDFTVTPLMVDESSNVTYEKGESLGDFTVLAYCPCTKCCGEDAQGLTATGIKPTANHTIAVDPSVIPLGTVVFINDQAYVAEDTGVSGNRVDIYFDSHQEALAWGMQTQTVYLAKEVEVEDDTTSVDTTTDNPAGDVGGADSDTSTDPVVPPSSTGTEVDTAPYIIVLDPGHGGAGTGASRNWGSFVVDEATINFKISNYTKAYLEETYKNVEVYLTKNALSENPSIANRVALAVNTGADVLVSQHINSTGTQTTTASGVLAIVPKVDSTHAYNKEVALEAQTMARGILDELVALGFNDMGFLYKLSGDNTLYPDGSLADYYGIVKRCREASIPGTIIEHGFCNNESDALKLASEDMLKKMGEADARGIAAYLGLQEKHEHAYDAGVITTAPSCETTGIKTFTCTGCGQTITEVIAATGHTEIIDEAIDATCKESGLTEGKHCLVCEKVFVAQEVIPATGHDLSNGYTIHQMASMTTEGYKSISCAVCGVSCEETVIAKIKEVTLANDTFIYDGNKKQPLVTALDANDEVLVESVDYTVTYDEDCVEVGTYYVTITFMGDYEGVETRMFVIEESDVMVGDINEDGKLNIRDVMKLKEYLADSESVVIHTDAADLDGNGKINIRDVMKLKEVLANQ